MVMCSGFGAYMVLICLNADGQLPALPQMLLLKSLNLQKAGWCSHATL